MNPGQFKKGNQYWRLAEDAGRPRKFNEPEEFIKLANEYFQYVDENPLISIDFKGKDATECEIPKMRPYTIQGFCNFIGIHRDTLNEYKKRDDFSTVISHIVQIIENQQFEGASSGFLNPNIIARSLGLIDKKEVEVDGNVRYILQDE